MATIVTFHLGAPLGAPPSTPASPDAENISGPTLPVSELRCLCELSFQQSAMCQDGSLPAGDLLATVSERSGKALADLSDEGAPSCLLDAFTLTTAPSPAHALCGPCGSPSCHPTPNSKSIPIRFSADVHQFLYFPGAMVVYGDEKAFMRNIGLHEDYSQGAGHLAAVERAGAAALTRTRSNQARSASASASASASGSEKGDAVPRANGASAGRDTDTSADAPAGACVSAGWEARREAPRIALTQPLWQLALVLLHYCCQCTLQAGTVGAAPLTVVRSPSAFFSPRARLSSRHWRQHNH